MSHAEGKGGYLLSGVRFVVGMFDVISLWGLS